MQKILLLGNGLNNLQQNDCSWENILRKQIEEFDRRNQTKYMNVFLTNSGKINSYMEYPFLYDLVINEKDIFFQELNKIETHGFVKKYLEKYDTILTTNFTTEFEKIDGVKWKNCSEKTEKKYSLFRKKRSGSGKSIWYIHGCLDSKNSVMMGQSHYVEQTGKIASYLDGKYKLRENDKEAIEKIEDRIPTLVETLSWVDYFFMKDIQIDIVGFGFSLSETDLWYVLKRRKEMKASGLIDNEIIYHCLKSDNDYNRIRKASLNINNVVVKDDYHFNSNGNTYQALYQAILEKI